MTTDASPCISVVLLTYNHELYFEEALASVLGQQVDCSFEVLVSEDRSSDRTGDLAEAAAKEHAARVTLIRSPRNLNTNRVTSRALEVAKGEYVAFLDGDDFWTSQEKLQRQVDFLRQHPECSMVFHDVVVVDATGNVTDGSFRLSAPSPEVAGYEEIVRSCFVAGPSAMIRKAALLPLPTWFDDAEFGDWPLYILAAEKGRIAFLPDTLAAYRVHPGGYWSGMAEDERSQRCLRFLRFVSTQTTGERRSALRASERVIRWELLKAQLRGGRFTAALKTLRETL